MSKIYDDAAEYIYQDYEVDDPDFEIDDETEEEIIRARENWKDFKCFSDLVCPY